MKRTDNSPRPLLVLVPGLACDDTVWQPLLPALHEQADTWVPPPAVHHRISDMAADLLQQAPAERFALAGHSLGGRIALEVMRQAPQRVLRLALLDTGWQAQTAATADTETASRLALVDLARREGMRAMGERWTPPMLHPAHREQPVHAAVLDMVAAQSVDRFAAQQQALIHRPDASAVLDAIRCPTLLLCGEEDGWSPLAQHQAMAERIAGSTLVAVPHCGHMSTMEQPQTVADALLNWLRANA